MALDVAGQGEWGGGIYRGRNAPANAVYDAVNALVDDEGFLFKRGGSAFLSASDAVADLVGVASLELAGGARDFAWSAAAVYVLDGANAPITLGGSYVPPPAGARAAILAGAAYFPAGGRAMATYAGSRKTGIGYSTGTADTTAGSSTVTGSGTSWLANVDPGMLFLGTVSGVSVAVTRVIDDTHLEVAAPIPLTTSGAYNLVSISSGFGATSIDLPTTGSNYIAALFQRLWMGNGRRIAIGDVDRPVFIDGQYHELAIGGVITGMDALADLVIIFTSEGVWAIANGAFDIVDDAGNVQQQVQRMSGLVLWGDAGIARFDTSLVVPAIDDVYLFAADGSSAPISSGQDGRGGILEKVRPQYRSYVKAGYAPGLGAVHRGHYWLPIMNGTTVVDVLVCRLDKGAAWTRFSGVAGSAAYAARVDSATRVPKLLGISAKRITSLADTLDPAAANAQDAGASNFDFSFITRDFPTSSSNHPGTVTRARLRYELEDDGSGATAAPAVALAFSSDQDAGAFTTLTSPGLERSASAGGGVSDGSAYSWWRVGKRRERIRFRVTVSGAAARFVLRTVELLIQQSGLR